MFKTILMMVVGIFFAQNVMAQPLSVDANTLALWNFNTDPSSDVVVDSSPNNVVGSARATALLNLSAIGQGKARYFVDQYSVITFPVPSPGSALDILSNPSWSFEFSIYLDRPSPEAINIFNNGQIAIEIQGQKIAATIQRFSSQYGVKTVQQISLNAINKIAVVYSNNEIGILVNGKVWASQSLDLNKDDKRNPLNVRLPVYLGGAPRAPVRTGVFGKQHGCAITFPNNDLLCWGSNIFNQLGSATTARRSEVPVPLKGISNVGLVSAGEKFTCAKQDSVIPKIFCWGSNEDGELGLPLLTSANKPVVLMDADGVVLMKSGDKHSCVINSDQTVKCWGRNVEGQLGLGLFSPRAEPTIIPGLTSVIDLAMGGNHSCALVDGGNVYCWGQNNHGQIGSSLGDLFVPTLVNGISNATKIAAGEKHSCASLESGEVKCWGANNAGQLGSGNLAGSYFPVNVSGILPDAAKGVYSGTGDYSCAHLVNNRMKCWGSNSHGQLGSPLTLGYSSSAINANITDISALSLGATTNCQMRFAGMSCMGANDLGQLGRGFGTDQGIFITQPALVLKQSQINGTLDEVRVSRSARAAIGRPVITFSGDDRFITENPFLTFNVAAPNAIDVTTVVVKLNDGIVTGLDYSGGQISGILNSPLIEGKNIVEVSVKDTLGNFGKTRVVLTYIRSDIPNIQNIYVGETNSCATNKEGEVYCWGGNAAGQLGTDLYQFTSSPVRINSLINIKMLGVSRSTICAVDRNSDVWCLGSNDGGKLGNFSTVHTRSFPLKVNLPKPISAIYASEWSFCARSNSELYCWGSNFYSQYQPGGAGLLAPVLVTTGIKSASIGNSHLCVLDTNNTVRCRGYNLYGQLGGYPTNESDGWVSVPLPFSATQVAVSEFTSCALTNEPKIYCWGLNSGHQFGYGVTAQPPYEYSPQPFPLPWPSSNPQQPDPAPRPESYYPDGSRSPIENRIISSAQNILLGEGFACSQTASAGFRCWGAGHRGQIGSGVREWHVGSYGHTRTYSKASVYGGTGCAIEESTNDIYCWGANNIGQAAQPDTLSVFSPAKVQPHARIPKVLSGISASEGNSCIRKGNDTFCWGSTNQGQLGLGDGERSIEVYPQLINLQNIVQSGLGYAHICHLDNLGKVYCAGNNESHQVNPSLSPKVFMNLDQTLPLPATKIAIGRDFSCSLLNDKAVWCWGNNQFGQIGNGVVSVKEANPSQVLNLGSVEELYTSAESFSACAIKTDRTVWCWGLNLNQEISSQAGNLRTPVEVPQFKNAVSLSLGVNAICALSISGVAVCAKANNRGQAGVGNLNTNEGYHTVKISSALTQIKSGNEHVCAKDIRDDLYCWGKNESGQIGYGDESYSVNLPRRVLSDVNEFALGGDHTCAITNQNKLMCWGFNGLGQLGNGSQMNTNKPEASDITK